jgi:hypothetical protein
MAGGRVRTIADRNCFPHLYPWRLLRAQELGRGSPATAWRRLTEWAKARVFQQLHLETLDRLGLVGRLDWTRASVDSASVDAKRGRIMSAQTRSIAASRVQARPRALGCRWRSKGAKRRLSPPVRTGAMEQSAPV